MSNNGKMGLVSRILGAHGKPIVKAASTVMIGVITSEAVSPDFAISLAGVCARPGALISMSQRTYDLNFPTTILHNSLVTEAQAAKVDRLMLVNGDMAFPPDALSSLLAWGDRDVVGAIYRSKVPPFNLIVGAKDGARAHVKEGISEVGILPLGCVLIKMSVFEKLDGPYFREPYQPSSADHPGGVVPEFVDFSNRVRERGMKLWADITLSAQVGHVGKNLFMAQEEYGDARIAGPAAA